MRTRELAVEPFRFDDLEGWRQLLRWLQCLRERQQVSDCEAPTRSDWVPVGEGVFADVGTDGTL